jgi:hypothetical protein
MSVSPQPLIAAPLSPPANGSPSAPSNSELATLLSRAYAEVESLKQQLSLVSRRAERAERFNSASASTSTAQQTISELESRLEKAELDRDEAGARLARIQEHWLDFDRWFSHVDARLQENRLTLSKIVSEGGGQLNLARIPLISDLSLAPHQHHGPGMPPPSSRHSHSRSSFAPSRTSGFSSLPLPPAPNPRVRQRPDSGPDTYVAQPPPKKHRNDGDRPSREDRAAYSESVSGSDCLAFHHPLIFVSRRSYPSLVACRRSCISHPQPAASPTFPSVFCILSPAPPPSHSIARRTGRSQYSRVTAPPPAPLAPPATRSLALAFAYSLPVPLALALPRVERIHEP